MTDTILQLEGVKKSYNDRQVLRQIDLSIRPGELTGIIGNNGQGKTTLMRIILGLLKVDSGKILIEGHNADIPRSIEQKRIFGYLPESVFFYPEMTGRNVLRFFTGLKKGDCGIIDNLLKTTGIEYAADQKVKTYSKGMKQRLGLAQALAGNPKLLILDEPTNGLDPAGISDFYKILADLRAQGIAILLSSHLLSEIESHLDRLAIMKDGIFVKQGSLETLVSEAVLKTSIRFRIVKNENAVMDRLVSYQIQKNGNNIFTASCVRSDKDELLQRLTGLHDSVNLMAIQDPGLDEIFHYFNNEH
ncbi:MAG: ABC transporter ATP-binding protein [Gammaproteobacteria bacterium]|nr:ABC transporter ATP-binding protein [Gammaproteobacteria bacterium]